MLIAWCEATNKQQMNFFFIFFVCYAFNTLQGNPVPSGKDNSFEVNEEDSKTADASTEESSVSKQIKENGSELDRISNLLEEIFTMEKSQGETGNIEDDTDEQEGTVTWKERVKPKASKRKQENTKKAVEVKNQSTDREEYILDVNKKEVTAQEERANETKISGKEQKRTPEEFGGNLVENSSSSKEEKDKQKMEGNNAATQNKEIGKLIKYEPRR